MQASPILILIFLLTNLNANAQRKSVYYIDQYDTLVKPYIFNAKIQLKPNKTFVYNFKRSGDCHLCETRRIIGTWKVKMDTIMLTYIHKIQEAEIFATSSYDSLQNDFLLKVYDQNGKRMSGVKIIDDYLQPPTNNEYYTDMNGEVIIKRDSLKLIRLKDNNLNKFIAFTFHYKIPNGKMISHLGGFELPDNIISFKINFNPVIKLEKKVAYYLKDEEKLTQVGRNGNDEKFEYLGDFKIKK
jgi:hypothetical protein